MIVSLLAGAILGIVLAILPGPVAVTAIKTSLNKGVREGSLVGLGTGVIDFLYCLCAVFATSAAMMIFDTFAVEYPLVVLSIQILIVFGILVYGFTHLKSKQAVLSQNTDPLAEKNKKLQFLSSKGPFFLGMAVALANIANPTFITSIAYLSVQMQKFGLIENTSLGRISYAVGFGLGNVIWIYAVVKTIDHYKSKMSDKMAFKIQKFAGFTLIGFGTLLGYRLIEFTKWSDILRLIFAV